MLTSAVTRTVDSKAGMSGGSIFLGKLLDMDEPKSGFLEFS